MNGPPPADYSPLRRFAIPVHRSWGVIAECGSRSVRTACLPIRNPHSAIRNRQRLQEVPNAFSCLGCRSLALAGTVAALVPPAAADEPAPEVGHHPESDFHSVDSTQLLRLLADLKRLRQDPRADPLGAARE